MPILLFLIDTSASMNQRTYLGTTYLDIAKGAVEIFMKLRARDPASRGDRYMLVTFDDPPYGVKAGWKENHCTFMSELKNLQASGLTTLGYALRAAFDLLNLNRLVSGIDNYGQGRNPFFLEPSVIITITDGNKLTHTSGVELTKEPFRWDQRLFALVLRLPGAAVADSEQLGSVPTDESAITQMCEVTGGRSYCVQTQRMLNQCLESLVQKILSGVVIDFEKTGPDPPLVGEASSLRPPHGAFHLCGLTNWSPHHSPNDLFKVHKLKPNLKWRQAFEIYLKTMPPYFLLAKIESDRLIVSVGRKAPQETGIKVKNHSNTLSLAHRKDFKQLLQGITGEMPLRLTDINFKERNLLDQLTRMRSNLLKTTQKLIRGQDEDYLHSIPVAQMGNYQEYLKMMPSPLRQIDPDQPKRLHTFGNPFKQDKKGMMIDEADEFVMGPQSKKRGVTGDPNSGAALKRRRSLSPLLCRPQTPPIITNHVGNSVLGTESNGESGLGPESGDSWPGGVMDGVGGGTAGLILEEREGERPGMCAEMGDSGEDSGVEDDRLGEDGLDERPPSERQQQNFEGGLSPPDQEGELEGDGDGADQAEPEAVTIAPLDGSNAELRTRVIKEVRKPGRNYETIFRLLEEVKGHVTIQRYFIYHAIKEAARFKKWVLIQQLETALEEIELQLPASHTNNDHGR
ncbi:unnamed protein product [Coregonus sp. 'balchen']|nr:unnamed protein product [Coregonus sp. 'balchen']